MQWLIQHFPLVLALPSFILGVIATAIVGWKMFPLQNKALESLVETQREHLTDQGARYLEMKGERDNYREEVHAIRKTAQTAQLKVVELESRPDFGSIQLLLENQSRVNESISVSLARHIENEAQMFKKVEESIVEIPNMMKEQTEEFNKRQAAILEPITKMCNKVAEALMKQEKRR